jgi:hypothetical protein
LEPPNQEDIQRTFCCELGQDAIPQAVAANLSEYGWLQPQTRCGCERVAAVTAALHLCVCALKVCATQV